MRWNINKDGINTGEVFDDLILDTAPGVKGFTRKHINAHLADLGEGFTADYMGLSMLPAEVDPEDTEDTEDDAE